VRRKWVEFHVRSKLSDGLDAPEELIKMAAHLGYRFLVLADFKEDEGLRELAALKEYGKRHGIDVASRANITVNSVKELKEGLRRIRRKVEVVGVASEAKEVVRAAARDGRVDVVSMLGLLKSPLDKGIVELMRRGRSALELNLSALISETENRRKILEKWMEYSTLAINRRVPIILASGAGSTYQMRSPRELIALALTIGMNVDVAVNGVSTLPLQIIRLNREKLKPEFVAPGITVIKKGGST